MIPSVLRVTYNIIAHLLMWALLLLFAFVCLLLSLMRSIIPSSRIRQSLQKTICITYRSFSACCYVLIKPQTQVNVFCSPEQQQLDRNKNYIMISNHQSWTDILILMCYLQRRTSNIKFMMKKQLLWQIPVAGWFCYINGFPMIDKKAKSTNNRASNNKIITQACNKMKANPSTLFIFPEGSRFSTAKWHQSQCRHAHVLSPKSHGIVQSIAGLGESLSGIINVTLVYHTDKITVTNLILGKIKAIDIHVSVIPLSEALPKQNRGSFQQNKAHMAAWLDTQWALKSQTLSARRQ